MELITGEKRSRAGWRGEEGTEGKGVGGRLRSHIEYRDTQTIDGLWF